MNLIRWILAGIFSALVSSAPVFAAAYDLDPKHTTVSFKIRHLLSYVPGTFDEFEGSFDYDPDKPESWKAGAVIQAASINTRIQERDDHLRGADFFEAEKFPTITFASTKVTDVTPGRAKLHGLLKVHGVEKPVVLDLEIHGVIQDPWGGTRSGFTATARINRKDFGLGWNKVLETGQLIVGEEVDITLEIEGVLKP